MVTLTEAAAERISQIAASEGFPAAVRAKVKGGGCAGFTYDLDFCEGPSETDDAYVSHGVTVVVDPISLQFLDGCAIDYREAGLLGPAGFSFDNPKSTGSCGCGNSFST